MQNSPATKKKRWLIIAGISVITIASIVLVISFGINTFLKPGIKQAVANLVINGSDSLYTFSLGDYTLAMGGSSVTLTNLNISVDSNRYYELKAAHRLPALTFSIQLSKAVVKGLSPWQLWRNKNIFCKSIELNDAAIHLQQEKSTNDTAAKSESKTLYEALKPSINEIAVGIFEIRNSDVTFKPQYNTTEKRDSLHFTQMRIKLTDIKVNAFTSSDTTRILYAANLETDFDSLKLKTKDGIYDYSTGKTVYDFKKRVLTIDGFRLKPAISQLAFNKKMGHEADRLTIHIENIAVNNFNAAALVVDNRIEAAAVNLNSPGIAIYKDKTAGPNNSNKMGKYPHQLLKKTGLPIDIDTIHIKDGTFTYTEKSAVTLKEGAFKFTNVNGLIPNITNQATEIEKNKWCRADLSASFMGNNDLHAVFGFDLSSSNGHFVVNANLASLNAADVNPLFRALANAEMETLSIDKLAYQAEGNDFGARGNLRLRYHNLKLNMLARNDNGELTKKGLMSLLANLFKLNDSNPEEGKAERIANNIFEKRIPTKNFFGLIVKTLLTCTTQIIVKGDNKSLQGLGGKKDKKK